MIEQTAVVVELDEEFAWVEAERESTCGKCAAKAGCGTSVLSRLVGNKVARMRAINKPGAQIGDTVIVGLKEAAMLKGSVAIYLLPLLFMFLFAITGKLVAVQVQAATEVFSIIFGTAGLVVGGLWLLRFTRRIQHDDQYQPVILRKSMPANSFELSVPKTN
jgi:sigma-E factor negative regulatory protein RseC